MTPGALVRSQHQVASSASSFIGRRTKPAMLSPALCIKSHGSAVVPEEITRVLSVTLQQDQKTATGRLD